MFGSTKLGLVCSRNDYDEVFEMALESAQVQIRLRYDASDSKLHVTLEEARNLLALAFPDNAQV